MCRAASNAIRFATWTVAKKIPTPHAWQQIQRLEAVAFGAASPRDITASNMCNVVDLVEQTLRHVEAGRDPPWPFASHSYTGFVQKLHQFMGVRFNPAQAKAIVVAGFRAKHTATGIAADLTRYAIGRGATVWKMGKAYDRTRIVKKIETSLSRRNAFPKRHDGSRIPQSEWNAFWERSRERHVHDAPTRSATAHHDSDT